MTRRARRRQLVELSRLASVQTSFTDTLGRRRVASDGVLRAILAARGIDADDDTSVERSLRAMQEEAARLLCERVVVLWDDRPPSIPLTLASGRKDRIDWLLVGEHERLEGTSRFRQAEIAQTIAGSRRRGEFTIPSMPSPGRYELRMAIGAEEGRATVLAAPALAWQPVDRRRYGVFAPLYALRSEAGAGIGDLGDAERLAGFAARHGGELVGMLPLLATYHDELFDPSPYAPVSRLFWNEIHLHLEKIPEIAASYRARALLESARFESDRRDLQAMALVDHRKVMAWKRSLLEPAAELFFEHRPEGRFAGFESFVEANPLVLDYARFRAASERYRQPWHQWPAPLREGRLGDSDYDPAIRDYHLYVQWLMEQQMQQIATSVRHEGAGLYLDYPLGSNPDGFDAWNEQALYVRGAAVGAPPDLAYDEGQNWGFRPPDPDGMREDGYRHWGACIRHQLQKASMLRLDHVMGLHRLLWIPEGYTPGEGAYVRYRAEELYAVLAMESHRCRAEIAGEDLGTVPREVRTMMRRHGLRRLFVLQRQLTHAADAIPWQIEGPMVASLNTHDMPPFAAFWNGSDIEERIALGVIKTRDREAYVEKRARARRLWRSALVASGLLEEGDERLETIMTASVAWLSRSEATVVLLNLEDLWLETVSQNIPTTRSEQRPNWRPKLKLSLDELERFDSQVIELLERERGSQDTGD